LAGLRSDTAPLGEIFLVGGLAESDACVVADDDDEHDTSDGAGENAHADDEGRAHSDELVSTVKGAKSTDSDLSVASSLGTVKSPRVASSRSEAVTSSVKDSFLAESSRFKVSV
jgi:hypothetical protein